MSTTHTRPKHQKIHGLSGWLLSSRSNSDLSKGQREYTEIDSNLSLRMVEQDRRDREEMTLQLQQLQRENEQLKSDVYDLRIQRDHWMRAHDNTRDVLGRKTGEQFSLLYMIQSEISGIRLDMLQKHDQAWPSPLATPHAPPSERQQPPPGKSHDAAPRSGDSPTIPVLRSVRKCSPNVQHRY